MTFSTPRVVIAGLRGGSGKTTLSIALLRLLQKKGYRIVPFKKGPDYIDPGWLAKAAGRACYNLDQFMMPEEKVLSSFLWHSQGADIVLVEGNRGLYDGVDPDGTYSTAELAKLLRSPVLVVVDCRKATRTVAAVLKGLQVFEQGISIKGVVLNNISGPRHERVIRGAIEEYTDLKVVGVMRSQPDSLIPERHLGLLPWQEHDLVEETIERIASSLAEGVDLDGVLEVAAGAEKIEVESLKDPYEVDEGVRQEVQGMRIGVFWDRAFQFYYPENIEILKRYGLQLHLIDAIEGGGIPELDILYIGGGFPETNALRLSENRRFITDLKQKASRGLPIYAECGGLMYLGEEIRYRGRAYEMAGILPVSFQMQDRPVAHGYTVVEVFKDSSFYPEGTLLKGHEFHYSRVIKYDRSMRFVFRMRKGVGVVEGLDGILQDNVFATYTHLHHFGAPEWIRGILNTAKRWAP